MTIRTKHPLAAAACGLALILAVNGCTGSNPAGDGGSSGSSKDGTGNSAVLGDAQPGIRQLGGSAGEMALQASRAFFAKAPAVVVVGTDSDPASVPENSDEDTSASTNAVDADGPSNSSAAAEQARELGIPLLVAVDDATGQRDFQDELDRLGAHTLITHGTLPDEMAGDREVVDGTGEGADIPDIEPAKQTTEPGFAVVVRSGKKADQAASPALATAQAAGADLHSMESADPRAAKNQEFFEDHAGTALYAIGSGFAKAREFSELAATAAEGKQLPGGGQLVFPARRMVALYGTPGTSALGILGEQDVDGAIELAKKRAKEYQPHSKEKVQPAFEIIATTASSAPGSDGNYSSYVPVEELEPWVKAAEEAGVYVVLDLQPGRNDFLTQAKHYKKLLTYPNVGIAYDPEWRLEPGQRHLAQIGSVGAAELNRTNDWLAELTRKERLPQKVVILHQFKLSMINDRSTLDTSHPELAMVLHADGNGTPGMKMATWNNLRTDLPEGIRMGWKNFIDEDSPTFTPEKTFDIDPKPWFVSYQ